MKLKPRPFTWQCLCGRKFTESNILSKQGVLALISGHMYHCGHPESLKEWRKLAQPPVSPRGRY